MKALIINTKKATFKNDKGDIVVYVSTTIGREAEASDTFAGWLVEEITGKVEDYPIIKSHVNKVVDVDLEYRKHDKKNYRPKLVKIAGITL